MTPPVEWHDNGPEFPDFLPPNPAPVKLTRQEAEARIERVLGAAGISLYLYATKYGPATVMATFPDGATFAASEGVDIRAEGYTRR